MVFSVIEPERDANPFKTSVDAVKISFQKILHLMREDNTIMTTERAEPFCDWQMRNCIYNSWKDMTFNGISEN